MKSVYSIMSCEFLFTFESKVSGQVVTVGNNFFEKNFDEKKMEYNFPNVSGEEDTLRFVDEVLEEIFEKGMRELLNGSPLGAIMTRESIYNLLKTHDDLLMNNFPTPQGAIRIHANGLCASCHFRHLGEMDGPIYVNTVFKGETDRDNLKKVIHSYQAWCNICEDGVIFFQFEDGDFY